MRRTDLPAMHACDGCKSAGPTHGSDCCTIVRARPEETKRIRHYMRDNGVVWLKAEGIKCGFLREGGACAIYDVRPWVCRAFGVVKQMPCPHFPEAAVVDLPSDKAIALRLGDPYDYTLGESFEGYSYLARMKAALAPAGVTA